MRLALVWAFWVGLSEVVWLAAEGSMPSWGGLLRVLALCALLGVVLGVPLGALRVAAGPPRASTSTQGGVGRRRDGRERDEAARVHTLLATCGLLGVGAPVSFVLSLRAIETMARPRFAALTVLLLHLGLVLVGLLVLPFARRLAAAFAHAFARLPVVGAALRSVYALGLSLAALAVAGAAIVAVQLRETLSYLPWGPIVAFGLGTLASVLWVFGTRRLPWALGVLGRVCAPLLAVLAVLGLLDLEGSRAAIAEARRVLFARLGHDLVLAALDVDGDGYLGVLGGRDCAPFDGGVSPSAVEVPGNGRDEDCDGVDLDQRELRGRPRTNWPLSEAVPVRPPVVLITIDAFAADRMKALGGRGDVTPRIDAFAKRSTLFTSCFSQGPSTRLSFPSIFTSRWDSQIERVVQGRHPFPMADSEVTLAEVLSKEGYNPVAVLPNRYFSRRRWSTLTAGFARVIESPMWRGGHNSRAVTDAALGALEHSKERPLFLWAHYYDAHSPHRQPRTVRSFGSTREDLYDAELLLVDGEVGRLLDGIEQRLGKEVLIVLTADHGIAFDAPRHSRFNYGYDLSTAVLHVPLIFRAAWLEPRVVSELVSTLDLAPTITNLLRVNQRLPFEGASLVPALLRGEATRPGPLVHEFYIPERRLKGEDPLEMISLRTDRYNLVHDRRVGTFELYDWRNDYFELEDLADSPRHRGSLEGLKRQLSLFTYRLNQQKASSLGPSGSAIARPRR